MILRKSQARKSIVFSIIGLIVFWPLSVRALVISTRALKKVKLSTLHNVDKDLFQIARTISVTGVILWPILLIALSLISILSRSLDSLYY